MLAEVYNRETGRTIMVPVVRVSVYTNGEVYLKTRDGRKVRLQENFTLIDITTRDMYTELEEGKTE